MIFPLAVAVLCFLSNASSDLQYINDVTATDCDFESFYIFLLNVEGSGSALSCTMRTADDPSKTTTINVETSEDVTSVVFDPAQNITLQRGTTQSVSVTVTGSDATLTFTITVSRPFSDDTDLSSFTLSDPCDGFYFAPEFTSYVCEVQPNVSEIAASCVAHSSLSTVTLSYSPESGELPFTPSYATVECEVVAEDLSYVKYEIRISRLLDGTAILNSLAADSGCALVPLNDEEDGNWTCVINNEYDLLGLTVDFASEWATLTTTGLQDLQLGTNDIYITITSQDTTATDDAYIFLIRKPPVGATNVSLLVGLDVDECLLNERLHSDVLEYHCVADVDNAIRTVDALGLSWTLLAANSSAVISGNNSLAIGDTTLDIVVTSQDGTSSTTYSLSLYRAASDDASITSISADGCDFGFDPSTWTNPGAGQSTELTCTVSYDVETLNVLLDPFDDEASVYLDGADDWAVEFGTNIKTVVVAASDGFSDTSWLLTVTRELVSVDDTLTSLIVDGCVVFEPAFSPSVTLYTCIMDASATAPLTYTADLGDDRANLIVTQPANLIFGTSELSFLVTAQDGVSSSLYTVEVLKSTRDALDTLVFESVDSITISVTFPDSSLDFSSTSALTDFASDLVVELDEHRSSFIGRFVVSSLEDADGVTVGLSVTDSSNLDLPDAVTVHDQFLDGFIEGVKNGSVVLDASTQPILATIDADAVSVGEYIDTILMLCDDDNAFVGIEDCYLHDYASGASETEGAGAVDEVWYDVFTNQDVLIFAGAGVAGLAIIICTYIQCKKRSLCCFGKTASRIDEDFDFDDVELLALDGDSDTPEDATA